MSKPITITGNAGRLEGSIARAQRNTRRAAVLCHPHPQFGGSMQDAVLDIVEGVLLAEGIDCVRFNFRGVGASQGSYDNGRGEADDAIAVLGWARTNIPQSNELWLAGYSFGAVVAWNAGQATDDLDRLLLIAPPIGRMELPGETPNIPVQVFAGSDDEYIDDAALDAWIAARGRHASLARIPGANHFFHSGSDALGKALRSAARQHND